MSTRRINDRLHGELRTTNATQTVISTYTLPSSVVCVFEASVVGRDAAGNAAVFRQVAATTGSKALVGSVTNVFPALISAGLAGAAVTMNISGGVLRVLVTGKAATTIDWSCDLRVWEN